MGIPVTSRGRGTELPGGYDDPGNAAIAEGKTSGASPGAAAAGPAELYLARQKPSARTAQRGALRRMVRILAGEDVDPETFAWERIAYADVARLREQLVGEIAPATINRYGAALRGVLREVWALGLVDGDTRDRLLHGFRNARVGRLQAGRVLSQAELQAIFTVCSADAHPEGRRDAAVVAVLLGAGLRREEAARLDVEDLEASAIRVRRGKGDIDRLAPLTAGVRAWIDAWLDVRGIQAGPLFPPVRRHKIRAGRVGAAALWRVVRMRAQKAGLAKPATPHDLRRSSATAMLEGGADLAVVQRVLGHRRLETTVRYDRRGREAEQRAAELVRVPVPGRGDA
jgi:integrase/recombinase XerD